LLASPLVSVLFPVSDCAPFRFSTDAHR
jgi:hypothetical protein